MPSVVATLPCTALAVVGVQLSRVHAAWSALVFSSDNKVPLENVTQETIENNVGAGGEEIVESTIPVGDVMQAPEDVAASGPVAPDVLTPPEKYPDAALPDWVMPVIIILAVLVVLALIAVVVLVVRDRKKSRPVPAPRKRNDAGRTQILPRTETATVRNARTTADVEVPPPTADVPTRRETTPRTTIVPINVGKLHGKGARKEQQDSFGVSDVALLPTYGQLVVVADGMGGLDNGSAVSTTAVETVLRSFVSFPAGSNPIHVLITLASEANHAVNSLLGPNGLDSLKTSGTTLAMALIQDGCLSFLSIGDSRISLLRSNSLLQLNREHTYEGELILRSINEKMPLVDALTDDQASGLVSYVGMGELRAVDIPAQPVRLVPGDKVILMTDGVYNALSEDEILKALKREDPEESAKALGTLIEEKAFDNQDNYTAVIVAYDGQ